MEQEILQKNREKTAKTLKILSIIALIFTAISCISLFITYYNYNHPKFQITGYSVIQLITRLSPAILLCICFSKKHKKINRYYFIMAATITEAIYYIITCQYYDIGYKFWEIGYYIRGVFDPWVSVDELIYDSFCLLITVFQIICAIQFIIGLKNKKLLKTVIIASIVLQSLELMNRIYAIDSDFIIAHLLFSIPHCIGKILFYVILLVFVNKKEYFVFSDSLNVFKGLKNRADMKIKEIKESPEAQLKDLKQKYMDGLISGEEYEQKRKDIISKI